MSDASEANRSYRRFLCIQCGALQWSPIWVLGRAWCADCYRAAYIKKKDTRA